MRLRITTNWELWLSAVRKVKMLKLWIFNLFLLFAILNHLCLLFVSDLERASGNEWILSMTGSSSIITWVNGWFIFLFSLGFARTIQMVSGFCLFNFIFKIIIVNTLFLIGFFLTYIKMFNCSSLSHKENSVLCI